MWREARRLTAEARSPVRGDGHDRALAPLGRRLRLRRASAGAAPACRRSSTSSQRTQARVLPAVRGHDGADAPLSRDSRPRRGRLHERHVEGRRLDGDRPRCARVGRGMVRRATAGSPSTRHPVGARSRRRTRTRPTRPTRSGRSAPAGSSAPRRTSRRRLRGTWRRCEQTSADATSGGPTCSRSPLSPSCFSPLSLVEERSAVTAGPRPVTPGAAHRLPAPTSPTSCATRAPACSPAAPIGRARGRVAAARRRAATASRPRSRAPATARLPVAAAARRRGPPGAASASSRSSATGSARGGGLRGFLAVRSLRGD